MPKENEIATRGRFRLVVPIDASAVENAARERPLKVVIQDPKGAYQSRSVKLDAKGQGSAAFAFAQRPGTLRLAVGPDDATEEEIMGMQTIGRDIPARLWTGPELVLPPIKIHQFFFPWWRKWCRNFTIRGRVLCANGNPVPGAKVCAYDVDWWWWWISRQQVGCDVTDANGAFEIRFRWCCGWWPWWWWRRRFWRIDPELAEKIHRLLERDPRLPKLAPPSAKPSLEIFDRLLAAELPQPVRPRPAEIDPSVLAGLSEKLVAKLPKAPELERFRLWPWWPWQPWWDCTPDILFRVTQDCKQPDTVIVNEGAAQVRWNIPTDLEVTLTANADACCVETPLPEPPGNCVDLTTVCGVSPAHEIRHIGGNLGASAAPAGFYNPGAEAVDADRPFAGAVYLYGVFGDTADIDYYDFQYSDDGGTSWNDMPASACGSLVRGYLGDPGVFGEPGLWHAHEFRTTVAGRTLYESRRHFEANPGWSAVLHHWSSNSDLLLPWITSAAEFDDGTYLLRLRGWKWDGANLTAAVGGVAPDQDGILPLCISQPPNQANHVVLTLDNRLEGDGSGHPPSSPSHPCGAGTVHTCTLEPDTDIIAVKIVHADLSETAVSACGNVPVKAGDVLQIDFQVTDASRHLAFYTLIATYGENLMIPLIYTGIGGGDLLQNVPGATLEVYPAAGGVYKGPCYDYPDVARSAIKQGASSPDWAGGTYRLRIPISSQPGVPVPFPETCCYQLELRAYKRTIVSCTYGFESTHRNLSEYSFMVVV